MMRCSDGMEQMGADKSFGYCWNSCCKAWTGKKIWTRGWLPVEYIYESCTFGSLDQVIVMCNPGWQYNKINGMQLGRVPLGRVRPVQYPGSLNYRFEEWEMSLQAVIVEWFWNMQPNIFVCQIEAKKMKLILEGI